MQRETTCTDSVTSPGHKRPFDSRWECMEKVLKNGKKRLVYRPRSGEKFGRLTIIESEWGQFKKHAEVECECGKRFRIQTSGIRMGLHLSCPKCAAKTKSYKGRIAEQREIFPDDKIRSMWTHRYSGIISRCYDPNHRAYPNYGGRGIQIFGEWKEDRFKFFRYVKTLPGWDAFGCDLDRINNNGNYEPGNLRIVSRSKNSNNKRNSARIIYQGEEYTVREFREKFTPTWGETTIFYHRGQGHDAEYMVRRYEQTRK